MAPTNNNKQRHKRPNRKRGERRKIGTDLAGSNTEKVMVDLANKITRGLKFDQKPPPNRKGKKSRDSALQGLKLSLASAKYACAIMNPWAAFARDAYIPIGNGRPSFKTMTVQRLTFTIGTNGVGWICIAPTVSNDSFNVHFTDATYTGLSLIPYLTAATSTLNTGVQRSRANPSYSSNACSICYSAIGVEGGGVTGANAVFGRVVSAGVTATYTGTTMNEGGLLHCFVDPDHNTVVGATPAILGSRLECDVANVSRTKCMLTDCSLISSEADFDRSQEYYAVQGAASAGASLFPINVAIAPFSGGVACGPDSSGSNAFPSNVFIPAPTMCIMATGEPGNTIYAEVVQHLEYQGFGAEGRTTSSPVDRIGFEDITSALGQVAATRNSTNGMNFGDSFMRSLEGSMKNRYPVKSLSSIYNVV